MKWYMLLFSVLQVLIPALGVAAAALLTTYLGMGLGIILMGPVIILVILALKCLEIWYRRYS
jgi:hypothetical protein